MRACMPECFQQVDLGEARVTNPTWCPTQLPRDSILEPSVTCCCLPGHAWQESESGSRAGTQPKALQCGQWAR